MIKAKNRNDDKLKFASLKSSTSKYKQFFFWMREILHKKPLWCSGLATLLEIIKLFSSSAQLIMKFQLLINVEIVEISGKFRFNTQQLVIYPAHKCWHFNIHEQDKF